MIQTIKQTTLWLTFLAALVLGSCDKTPHELLEEAPANAPILTVALNTEAIAATPLTDVHLYFFNSTEMLAKHTYYPSMQALALDRLLMESGYYTVFAVLNTTESCVPTMSRAAELPQITFGEFCQWVKSIDNGTYPNLSTGLLRKEIKAGVSQIIIDLKKSTEAIGFSTVTLNLTAPSPNLPDFVPTRAAGDAMKLRAVISVYNKGTNVLVLRKQEFPTATSTEGLYTSSLLLTPGNYDVRLWCDYTTDAQTDNHYITTDADIIRILAKADYRANTDTRDAFTQVATIAVGQTDSQEAITLHRPLAKYRLVATDVAKYEELRLKRGYPALADLKISIAYEGYWPNAYSVKLQKPADSDTGYAYASALSEQGTDAVTVGKDYVLVNGSESFVTVTILFKNAEGKVVSGVKGVKIAYRAGYLTTVSGNFLTAGLGSGVNIETDWSGDYEVEF